MMKKVFISYSHHDYQEANAVVAFLANSPSIPCFIFDRDQKLGDNFRKRILRELDQASAIIVICSELSQKSPEVLFEVGYAKAKGVPIVPLFKDPDITTLPYLEQINGYSLHSGNEADTLKLLKKDLSDLIKRGKGIRVERGNKPIDQILKELGVEKLGFMKAAKERALNRQEIIGDIGAGTDIVIVGRTLNEWLESCSDLCSLINDKRVNLKIGILNVFALDPKMPPNQQSNPSWIEVPNVHDWNMDAALHCYNSFKDLRILPSGGTLEVYGLPFYVENTVFFYTEASGKSFCNVVLLDESSKKHASLKLKISLTDKPSLANLYKEWADRLLSDNRLLFRNQHGVGKEFGTYNRAKTILPKIEKAGLVDISVGWANVDWAERNIENLIERLDRNSEIYMVGRTFMQWSRHSKGFARQIAIKSIRCQIVIANPTMSGLKSLVIDDQAQGELESVYNTFLRELPIGFNEGVNETGSSNGYIEIYGIPTYVPDTFSLFKLDDGTEYCNLEPGIALTPSDRVTIFFKHVGENDIYSALRKVYKNIVTHDKSHQVAKLLFKVYFSDGKVQILAAEERE